MKTDTFFDLSPLGKLKDSDKPEWGKMSSQHMVEHLILAVQSSNGTLEISDFITPPAKLNVAKRFLMSDRPLPKNFVNTIIGEGLKPLINPDLDSAKKKFFEEIEKFENFFIDHPESKPINATFGPLNKEEWIQFHKKHFTHHFQQFGIVGD
jgi:oxepin-CoA hydrolase/3-oxo-5,6-dehydrosuberyl-CoA semialdehyde dehydrogenase